MLKLLSRYRLDVFFLTLLSLTIPIFFYKLGQSSLVSWDEAWYGAIAHNLLLDGDFLNLSWGDNAYVDHPPFGFLLMAFLMKIFGEGEFWVRFSSAILGFLSLIIVYLLGREIFNKWVGFASSIALSSAFWFLFRARSGNLDITLTFLFLLTLFLAFKASREKKYLVWVSVSLTALFLTKTLVPFVIIPALLLIFWRSRVNIKDLIIPLLVFIFFVGGWFLYQIMKDQNFMNYYSKIGLPGVRVQTNYLENLLLAKEYLHSGIGKWFWPGIASIALGFFLFQKRFLVLSVFCLIFFFPFILSEKGQIWHLIPVYPVMILLSFGVYFFLAKKALNILPFKLIRRKVFIVVPMLVVAFYFSFFQIRQAWYQFIDIPAFVSDEAILSREAGKYPYQFYIDGDFLPAAIFYSGKPSEQISATILKAVFDEENLFVMITGQWRLDAAEIPKSRYEILKSDRDRILILKK